MNSNDEKLEVQWPSIGLAYEFIRPSYDWAQRRMEVVDARLQAMQTLVVSLTLAVPAFSASVMTKHPNFESPWFLGAIFLFLLAMGTGVAGRIGGTLRLLSPAKLYELTEYSEWEFKKNLVYWAGKQFEANIASVNWKAVMINWMVGFMAAEVVCLVIWIREAF